MRINIIGTGVESIKMSGFGSQHNAYLLCHSGQDKYLDKTLFSVKCA